MRNYILFLIVLVFSFAFISKTVSAVTCTCLNCTDCTEKLNNASCDEVLLSADITNFKESACINQPENASNKIFNCDGHKIDGIDTDAYGIYFHSVENITIKNCEITDFKSGLYLYNVSGAIVENIKGSSNKNGIEIYSTHNTIRDSTFSQNTQSGVLIRDGNNDFINITASENKYGVRMEYVSGVNVINSTLLENTYDLSLAVSSPAHCDNSIQNVIGSGNREIHLYNSTVNIQNLELSELVLCDADDSYFKNITVTGSTSKQNNGLFLYFTDNANLTEIDSSGNLYGIYLYQSTNNHFSSLTLDDNYEKALLFSRSSDNDVVNFIVNSRGGVELDYSHNNRLEDCYVINTNSHSILLYYSNYTNIDNCMVTSQLGGNGLHLYQSSYNNITNCISNDNYRGLFEQYGSHNIVENCTFNNNKLYGIYSSSSSYDLFKNCNALHTSDYYALYLYYNVYHTEVIGGEFSSNGDWGIRLENLQNCSVKNVTTNGIVLASNADYCSVENVVSTGNTKGDVVVYSSCDYNTFKNITVGTSYPTSISFSEYSGTVTIKGVENPPPDPSGYKNISKYFEASASTLFINVSYSDSDIESNEESLKIWKWNGTDWLESGWNGTRVLDTDNNVVGVYITSFSIFAPLYFPYVPPNVELKSPSNGSEINQAQVTFICQGNSTTGELVNATLYWNYGGGWSPVETVSLSGNLANATFTKTFSSSAYLKWNCYICNDAYCSFANDNYTVNIILMQSTAGAFSPSSPAGRKLTFSIQPLSILVKSIPSDTERKVLTIENGESDVLDVHFEIPTEYQKYISGLNDVSLAGKETKSIEFTVNLPPQVGDVKEFEIKAHASSGWTSQTVKIPVKIEVVEGKLINEPCDSDVECLTGYCDGVCRTKPAEPVEKQATTLLQKVGEFISNVGLGFFILVALALIILLMVYLAFSKE
mgnify:CR=1 FL=1